MLHRKCIFCKSTDGPFNTIEHIVPESLGGDEWAVMSRRGVCDKCQNYFGAKIESVALNDYPFSHWRTFSGIKTKKGKYPFFRDFEGTFYGGPEGVSIEFNPMFHAALREGRKTRMILNATPYHARILGRFLCKMGLELVFDDEFDDIFDPKFDAARQFSRFGDTSLSWWFLFVPQESSLVYELVGDDFHHIGATKIAGDEVIFHMLGPNHMIVVPLTENLDPPSSIDATNWAAQIFSI